MLHTFIKQNRWFLIALGASLLLTIIITYILTGQRAIEVTRAQNAARATSLSSAIVGLPPISSISPAETSGAVDYVATSRLDLAKQVPVDYTSRYSLWLYGVMPAYYASAAQQSQHATLAKDTVEALEKTTSDLTKLKKFIEYMPLVDLEGSFSDDMGRDERLQRTKQGITDTIEHVKLSGFPHEAEIVQRLESLNTQTLLLTDKTKAVWAAELLGVQKLILSDIESRDIQQGKLPEQLQAIYQ